MKNALVVIKVTHKHVFTVMAAAEVRPFQSWPFLSLGVTPTRWLQAWPPGLATRATSHTRVLHQSSTT